MSDGYSKYAHLNGDVPLYEYFKSEEDLAQVLTLVKFKVAGTMLSAVCQNTGRSTGIDNYVSGVGERTSDLVSYIMRNIRGLQRVFGHDQLPKDSIYLTKGQWNRVLLNIHRAMVREVLEAMIGANELWYWNSDWCFSNVVRLENDRANKEKKANWHDQRNFHGRPSKQGRRRAKSLRKASSVSIGGYEPR